MKIVGAEDWTMTLVISGPGGISAAKSQRVGVLATRASGDASALLAELRDLSGSMATAAFRDLVYIHFGGAAAVNSIADRAEVAS
jgi:hypothetical protein